jgi:hypothetical protein
MIHCAWLKWYGEKKVTVLSEWEHGYDGMIRGVHHALCQADAVATYNGARFDIPKLDGQFALLDIGLPPKPTQIDIYKAARGWGFICNKLDYLAPLFGLGGKVKHPGLELWINVHNGCPKAQKLMAKYCAGDVRLTEDLFERVKPYIRNLPRLAKVSHDAGSPQCRSKYRSHASTNAGAPARSMNQHPRGLEPYSHHPAELKMLWKSSTCEGVKPTRCAMSLQ